jgi:MFS transporter, DHA1 family, inner membrane transport protein
MTAIRRPGESRGLCGEMNQARAAGICGGDATRIVILLWAAAAGTSFFSLAPALVGALIDHLRLSVREVGLISSGELAGSAVGSVLVLLYGPLFSARTTLAASLALLGIANLATAAAHDFTTIGICRAAAGVGGGLAFSAVNAAAARARKPGPMFAAISVVQMVFGVAGFIGVPLLIAASGLGSVFVLLGACSLGCAIACAFSIARAPVHTSALLSSLTVTPRGALLLVSLFATYLTSTAVWTYLERIAVAAQLPRHVISIGLSIGMIAGVLGSLGATALLIRARNTDSFVMAGAAIMAISTALLIKAAAPAAYLTALFGFNGALALVTPLYQTRLAAESGGDGRILVAMLAMYLGLILGPMLGAGVVMGLGYQDLIHIAAALFLAAALLALGSSRLSPQELRS